MERGYVSNAELSLLIRPWITSICFWVVKNSFPQVVILGLKSDDFKKFYVYVREKVMLVGSFKLYPTLMSF